MEEYTKKLEAAKQAYLQHEITLEQLVIECYNVGRYENHRWQYRSANQTTTFDADHPDPDLMV